MNPPAVASAIVAVILAVIGLASMITLLRGEADKALTGTAAAQQAGMAMLVLIGAVCSAWAAVQGWTQ